MFRSTLIVSFLSALGAGISFLNQLVLARYFGTSAEMDAYLIAVSLPMTISGLLSGVLNYQLVPELQRVESSHGGAAALIQSLLLGLGGGAAIIGLGGILAADWLVLMLNPGLTAPVHDVTVRLAHITWICLPLSVLGSIYVAGLHIRQQFAAATLLVSAPIMGSMIVCLSAHAQFGIAAVVWGQLLGYGAMVGGLRLAHGKLRTGHDWIGLQKIVFEFPRAVAAVLIFVLYPFSDAFWGSRIGPAAVSYLGYAQRLLVGFSGLAVVGLTTVLFPRLARHAAEGNDDALRQDLGASIRIMLVCMVPGATIFSMLATPSLQLLFQRGSFQLADAAALGSLLPVMLSGMVAMSCAGLVFKALFARREAGIACLLSVSGAVIYFALSGILGRWLGLEGIGIAYAISWCLVFGFGLGYLWRKTPFPALVLGKMGFISQLAAAAILVALICLLGVKLLPVQDSPSQQPRLLVVAGIWIAALAAYLGVGALCPALPEVRQIRQKFIVLVGHKQTIPG